MLRSGTGRPLAREPDRLSWRGLCSTTSLSTVACRSGRVTAGIVILATLFHSHATASVDRPYTLHLVIAQESGIAVDDQRKGRSNRMRWVTSARTRSLPCCRISACLREPTL